MCYVATYFPFVVIPIYMPLTRFSATLVFPFSRVIVPIWFPFYEFIKAWNVAMIIHLSFFDIISIAMTSFPNYYFLLCSALMTVRIFWLSSAPNCVAYFHSNLYDITIVSAFKLVTVPASFLWLGIFGRLFVLFFFIAAVTSFRFLHIPTRELLVTVSFLVGLCALLGDVVFSFASHLLHIAWVEALFEVLAVHSIEEWSIGFITASASTPTTSLPSSATASSATFTFWDPSNISPASLVLVSLCDSKGFSDLGFHIVHSDKPIPKLVVLDFGIGQHDGWVLLNLNPSNQLLHHFLLCDLVPILFDCQKCCLQACSLFCKWEGLLVLVEQALLWVQRDRFFR